MRVFKTLSGVANKLRVGNSNSDIEKRHSALMHASGIRKEVGICHILPFIVSFVLNHF